MLSMHMHIDIGRLAHISEVTGRDSKFVLLQPLAGLVVPGQALVTYL